MLFKANETILSLDTKCHSRHCHVDYCILLKKLYLHIRLLLLTLTTNEASKMVAASYDNDAKRFNIKLKMLTLLKCVAKDIRVFHRFTRDGKRHVRFDLADINRAL